MDMNTAQLFFSGNIEMNDWIPFRYEKGGPMVDFGEMVLTRTAGSAGNTYYVGVWRCDKLGKTFFSSDAGDETLLIQEGKPHAEIVVAEKPPRMTKLAANELQEYLRKMTGAKVPITTTPSGGKIIPIYVGRSVQTDQRKQ